MTTNPIGVGILGCGFIARAHMRGYMTFPTEIKIVALYNRTWEEDEPSPYAEPWVVRAGVGFSF